MAKFRIFSPSGIEACPIEAVSKISTVYATLFYDYEAHTVGDNPICELPKGWVAIPEDIIVKNENENPDEVPSLREATWKARKMFGEWWERNES
jgi:hypothetical protein